MLTCVLLVFPCLSPALTKVGVILATSLLRDLEVHYVLNQHTLNKVCPREHCQDSLTDGILASASMVHVRSTKGHG